MDFANANRMVYSKDCPYYAITNDIVEAQMSYGKHYEEFVYIIILALIT